MSLVCKYVSASIISSANCLISSKLKLEELKTEKVPTLNNYKTTCTKPRIERLVGEEWEKILDTF